MSNFCDYEEFTWLATIVDAQGINGAVHVKYFTDTPEYYIAVKLFFIETEGELIPFKVLRIRPSKKGWIIVFEGINSRNVAEKFKGCRILLKDKDLKPLDKNEFFVHQIIGCRVEDNNGFYLGKVTNFLETAANNVYQVQNGDHEFLVPDVPHVVLEFDLEKGKIIIDPIPGLI